MKKVLAVLLSAFMVFSISACSTEEEDEIAPEAEEITVSEPSEEPEVSEFETETTAEFEVDSQEPESETMEETEDVTDENPIIDAIERRHFTDREDFTGKEIDEDVLWLLGWAATGTNREGAGYAVPLAMGADPFVSVYLAQESGVRRFSWETNDFEHVSDLDIRSQAALMDLSDTVTAVWIFVIEVDQVPNDNMTWAYHAIGAMSEHQYLVAEAYNVQARYMASVDADAVSELLEFGEEKLPADLMMMAQK